MSTVAPYAGQNQQIKIVVPRTIAFRQNEPEEGGWGMPPYSEIFDFNSQPPFVPVYHAPVTKPQPWLEQIEIPYSPTAPPRITGRTQPSQMVIQATSVMPPYGSLFPAGTDYLPPPVYKTDIFAAQQTWPL